MSMLRKPGWWAFSALALLAPAVALAQSGAEIELRRGPPVWLGYLVMFVLMLLVVAPAARRGRAPCSPSPGRCASCSRQ